MEMRASSRTAKKPSYRNFTEFFTPEPKEVWVKNIAEGPVCMQILIGNGVWEPVKLPFNRDPFRLPVFRIK